MYGKKFYRRRPRKYLRKRKTGYKRRSAVSSRIKRYVKREIHRNIENKEHLQYGANQSITCGDFSTMTYPLITSLGTGTDDSQKIGNQIKITKGIWRCCVNLLPYNATTNPQPLPCWVKVWVVRDLRNNGQLSTMDSTTFGNFFRGNATGLSFQCNPLDLTLDVNQDRLRVLYSKVFKLGTTAIGSTPPTNTVSYTDNSPMAKYLTINWARHCKKQLKYDDGAALPNNENIYFVIQAVSCEGSSNSGKQLIEMHYTNSMRFEDA